MGVPANVERMPLPGGCGKLLFDLRTFEEHIRLLGSTKPYLEGEKLGLDTQTKLGYRDINAGTLMMELLIPAARLLKRDYYDVGRRIARVVDEWASIESGRRDGLYAAFATFDTKEWGQDLEATESEQKEFDFKLRTVFSFAFSEKDHMTHLEEYHSALGQPSENDLTAIERMVYVLYWQQERKLCGGKKESKIPKDSTRIREILSPFIASPFTSVDTKKYGTVIFLRSTPEASGMDVPVSVWWYGLLASADDVKKRVRDNVVRIIDSHNGERINTLVDLVELTPVGHDYNSLWWNLRDALADLAIRPDGHLDGLFRVLARKLREYPVDPNNPVSASFGYICPSVEMILNWAEESERETDLITEEEAGRLVAKILQVYPILKPRIDGLERTWLLNLAERLVSNFPEITRDGQIRSSVERICQQLSEEFEPYDDLIRKIAEMSEREAAQSLMITALSRADRNLEPVWGGVDIE